MDKAHPINLIILVACPYFLELSIICVDPIGAKKKAQLYTWQPLTKTSTSHNYIKAVSPCTKILLNYAILHIAQ